MLRVSKAIPLDGHLLHHRMRPSLHLPHFRGVSHEVKNAGSTARDNLANERTFLSWSRTGLAFVGAGLGYFYAQTAEKKKMSPAVLPATGLLVTNGLAFLGFATGRYFSTLRCLQRGTFPVLNRFGIAAIIFTTGSCTAGALFLIFADRLNFHLQLVDDEDQNQAILRKLLEAVREESEEVAQ